MLFIGVHYLSNRISKFTIFNTTEMYILFSICNHHSVALINYSLNHFHQFGVIFMVVVQIAAIYFPNFIAY